MDDIMSMDVRHSDMIRHYLLNINVDPPPTYIEVGSCYGVSTFALLEASKITYAPCILIDIDFKPNVLEMLEDYEDVDVSLVKNKSVNVLPRVLRSDSILLLNGDHRLCTVSQEIEYILEAKPRIVILHDVDCMKEFCDGPLWAFGKLQQAGYNGVKDNKRRVGERTDRGLGILCLNYDDYEIAKQIINQYS
jgi:cephalosporin hydroxylase